MINHPPQLDQLAGWRSILDPEMNQSYFKSLLEFVAQERQTGQVFPPADEVFTAFSLTPFHEVKVVILGQDPYHDYGQAHGLSFSVKKGVKLPPSLQNIFKELQTDLGIPPSSHGNLSHWAGQGVLLLNAVLTVRAHQPNSHKDQGWERFTDAVIRTVSEQRPHVVFVLWGRYAQKKIKLIDLKKHTIIQSAHPSPFSAHNGFFSSLPFSKINAALSGAGESPIHWNLPQ
ncbi:MAG: uracil-DNA glycosylase [Gomphosphaeria aponina SAG 52.96 = DSM 107014]|uniref:Uracil-DNA glycosylase n=1 Tax=Gomphosphaeria aponina SAG 52.96 = DSM 107014 TaxID=1521640 RepID=A0A941GRI5_9CHRO|nr:uracil-DNA glycosylase [Gomphosphaeria aponina SAG 52.96 = DSM 107014]